MLQTEQNTVAMGNRVHKAACLLLELDAIELQTDFEHGQWWVTHRPTGAQWSVCDAEGPGSADGFCFEQVTPGDDG